MATFEIVFVFSGIERTGQGSKRHIAKTYHLLPQQELMANTVSSFDQYSLKTVLPVPDYGLGFFWFFNVEIILIGFEMSFSADKFIKRMYRRIEGIVWDITTGATGLKTAEGIFTIAFDPDGKNPQVTVNPFDMSLALPGFATQTPHDQVKVGDIIVGDKQILGWVIKVLPASFTLLDVSGMTKQYTPPKVAIVGGTGPLVVRNLFSLTGGQEGVNSMLPMLMMFGGDDGKMEEMLPLLLMQQQPTAAGAANPMASLLPFFLMKKSGLGGGNGGNGGKINPMMLMAMSGGMGGAAGGINPMLMMAMADGFGDNEAPSLPTPRPASQYGNRPPPLSSLA